MKQNFENIDQNQYPQTVFEKQLNQKQNIGSTNNTFNWAQAQPQVISSHHSQIQSKINYFADKEMEDDDQQKYIQHYQSNSQMLCQFNEYQSQHQIIHQIDFKHQSQLKTEKEKDKQLVTRLHSIFLNCNRRGRPALKRKRLINDDLSQFMRSIKTKLFKKLIQFLRRIKNSEQRQKLVSCAQSIKVRKSDNNHRKFSEKWHQLLFTNSQLKPYLAECLNETNFKTLLANMAEKNSHYEEYLKNRIPLLIYLEFDYKTYSKFKVFYRSYKQIKQELS